MKQNNNLFPQRLRSLRKARKWRQKDVAEKINTKVSPSTVTRWETGAIEPNQEQQQALADLFSVSLDYLSGRSEQRQQSVDLHEVFNGKIPNFKGVPLSEEQAGMLSDILESYYKRKVKEMGLEEDPSEDYDNKS